MTIVFILLIDGLRYEGQNTERCDGMGQVHKHFCDFSFAYLSQTMAFLTVFRSRCFSLPATLHHNFESRLSALTYKSLPPLPYISHAPYTKPPRHFKSSGENTRDGIHLHLLQSTSRSLQLPRPSHRRSCITFILLRFIFRPSLLQIRARIPRPLSSPPQHSSLPHLSTPPCEHLPNELPST